MRLPIYPLTPSESRHLIASAGGGKAFGKLLHIDQKPGYRQRINNWRLRGIPASVVLAHLKTIKRLTAKMSHGKREVA